MPYGSKTTKKAAKGSKKAPPKQVPPWMQEGNTSVAGAMTKGTEKEKAEAAKARKKVASGRK